MSPPRSHRISALVGVRDDVDVLAPCVDNLLRLGCDSVLIVAVAAAGEVRTRIAALAGTDRRLAVSFCAELDAEGRFLTREGEFLEQLLVARPDWVLACDADEFLVLRGTDIHDVEGLDGDGPLMVPRYNHARRLDQPAARVLAALGDPGAMPVFARRSSAIRQGRMIDGARWSQHTIGPKVMFRPERTGALGQGLHSVRDRDGAAVEMRPSRDMMMMHLPFTSYERFEIKVRNARQQLAALPEMHARQMSWHWKEWIRHLDAGTLPEVFRAEALGAEEYAALETAGDIRVARAMLDAQAAC